MVSTGSNSSVQEADVAAARADFVVGLTCYNDARTIGGVVRAMRDGLVRYFASASARFVLVDAGSTDGTREAAREVAKPSELMEVANEGEATYGGLPYHGYPARAAALRT